MGAVHLRHGSQVSSLLIPSFPPGRAAPAVARPDPSTRRNPDHERQSRQPARGDQRADEWLRIEKIRLETQLIEAGMRRDRVRLVLDIVKWTVIAAAVVRAAIAADHAGLV